MQRPCLKSAIIGFAVVLTTLLSGCGTLRIAYNQGPDLVYWWADGHVDFDDAQTERVRADLQQLFAWHRATQLPDYRALLGRAKARVVAPEPATADEACSWYGQLQARTVPLVDRALPAVARAALALTPAQLRHLQHKYDKNNDKFRDDYLQRDPEKRRRAAIDRIVDRTETLYGWLDDAQKARIGQLVAASPFDPERWLAERQQRQKDTLATLRRLHAERATPEVAEAALRALVARVQVSPREAYRAYDERLRAYNCGLGAEVHNGMSREQRQAAADRLQGWADDLGALSR